MSGKAGNLFYLFFTLTIDNCILVHKSPLFRCICQIKNLEIGYAQSILQTLFLLRAGNFLNLSQSVPRQEGNHAILFLVGSIYHLGAHTELLTHPLADLCTGLNFKNQNTGF